MRKPDSCNRVLTIVVCLLFIFYSVPAQDLSYYLPDSVTYNPAIPKPKDIIYHEPGEWHVTHDRLVNYMQAIAKAAPDRVKLELMGFTYESRPQVLLIITSPQNHQRLEEIRQQHVQLSDPTKSASLDIEHMPIVLYIGHSIHGNESSAICIPVKAQTMDADKLYDLIKTTVEQNGITAYALQTGNAINGSDLGSWKMRPVAQPYIAMLTGTGVNATDAGEIWYLLDQQFNIPSTHLEVPTFNRCDLNKYNTLIMVGGTYNNLDKEKLRSWIQAGGTFIVTEEAVQWAAQNGFTNVTFKKPKEDTAKQVTYAEREYRTGAQKMNGAIFRAAIDLSHPLAYGYNYPFVDLFKANAVYPERNKNPYSNPLVYGDKPLQSGFVTKENYDAIKNSAAVLVNTLGNGRVISIADNPNFRAFRLGGTKLFMNAIFFGRIIEPGSGRNE